MPKIRLAREPEGRIRFLSEDEIPRLLGACEEKRSKSPYLLPIVTLALHTGMRPGEILGLTWDRMDFSRGVLRLEQTKSGRRREVPMNQAVYDLLSALPGHDERWFAAIRGHQSLGVPPRWPAATLRVIHRYADDSSWPAVRAP